MRPRPSERRAPLAVALLAILLLGGWLRFDRILDTSPFLWDDAIHHLEAVWLHDAVRFARASVERKVAENRGGGDLWTWEGERRRFRDEVGGLAPRFGRPGHMVLVALVMGIVGPVPWAGPLVSAIAGTLSIAALFGLVRTATRDSPRRDLVALFAAVWLAIDPLAVRLSREGLADADGALFAILAFWVYARARRPGAAPSWCALAGLAAGIAFTVQTRNFLVLAFLVGWDAMPGSLAAGRPARERALRIATMVACAALPLAACELPYYLALAVGRAHGIAPDLRSYLLQVLGIFANHHYAKKAYVHASAIANLTSYPLLFRAITGTWLPQVIVAGGALVAARDALRGTGEDRASRWMPLSWLVGSFVFLSVTAPLGRYASFFLPASAWLAAEGMRAARAATRVRGADRGQALGGGLFSPSFAFVWFFLLLVTSVHLAAAAVRETRVGEPGYRSAVAWMREHDGARHVSTSPYDSAVWAGVDAVQPVPATRAELDALVASGHRYLLVDLIRNYFLGAFATRGELLRSVTEHCAPAATFPNAWAARPEYLFELNYDVRETRKRIAAAASDPDDRSGVIDVYDLSVCTARIAE